MKKLVHAAYLTVSLIVIILLAGCAPTATQYAPLPNDLKVAPEPGKARICVVRGYVFWLSSASVDNLREDGTPRGDLVNGSYICWERPPGTAHLVLNLDNWDSPGFQGDLPVQADKVYYLYKDALSPALKSIPAAEGQKYLAEYPKPEVPQAVSLMHAAGNQPPSPAGSAGAQPSIGGGIPGNKGAGY